MSSCMESFNWSVSLQIIGAITIVSECSRGILFPILWPLCEYLGGNALDLGYLVACFALGRVCTATPLGYYCDVYRHRKSLIISNSILLIGSILAANASNQNIGGNGLRLLYVSQFILGCGSGSIGVTQSYVIEQTQPKSRTNMLSLINAFQYIGFTLSPFVGSMLHSFGTKSSIFLGFALPSICLGILSVACMLALLIGFHEIPLSEYYFVSVHGVSTSEKNASHNSSSSNSNKTSSMKGDNSSFHDNNSSMNMNMNMNKGRKIKTIFPSDVNKEALALMLDNHVIIMPDSVEYVAVKPDIANVLCVSTLTRTLGRDRDRRNEGDGGDGGGPRLTTTTMTMTMTKNKTSISSTSGVAMGSISPVGVGSRLKRSLSSSIAQIYGVGIDTGFGTGTGQSSSSSPSSCVVVYTEVDRSIGSSSTSGCDRGSSNRDGVRDNTLSDSPNTLPLSISKEPSSKSLNVDSVNNDMNISSNDNILDISLSEDIHNTAALAATATTTTAVTWIAMILLNMSCKGSIAVMETIGVQIALSDFSMTPLGISTVVSAAGAIGCAQLLLFKQLYTNNFSDIQLIQGGIFVMMISQFLMISYPDIPISQSRFMFGFSLMYALGYPVAHTAVLGLFSKIQKMGRQGAQMGKFSAAGGVARIIMPIVSSYLDQAVENGPFTLLLGLLTVSLALIILARSRIMQIVEEVDFDAPSTSRNQLQSAFLLMMLVFVVGMLLFSKQSTRAEALDWWADIVDMGSD
eukprot:gene12061-25278_t